MNNVDKYTDQDLEKYLWSEILIYIYIYIHAIKMDLDWKITAYNSYDYNSIYSMT